MCRTNSILLHNFLFTPVVLKKIMVPFSYRLLSLTLLLNIGPSPYLSEGQNLSYNLALTYSQDKLTSSFSSPPIRFLVMPPVPPPPQPLMGRLGPSLSLVLANTRTRTHYVLQHPVLTLNRINRQQHPPHRKFRVYQVRERVNMGEWDVQRFLVRKYIAAYSFCG